MLPNEFTKNRKIFLLAIAKDTALRRELLSSLELAKFSLRSDIESLEKSRNCEKEAHCETKNRLMLQEHECATLRVDRRRYVRNKNTTKISQSPRADPT